MESWGGGIAYDRFMGRWSQRIATEFVAWLDQPSGRTWLDVGSGTGALIGAIAESADAAAITGVEPAPAYLEQAHRRWGGTATLIEGEAEDLPLPDGAFDVAVSGLVLNFVPDPDRAAAEMARVVGEKGAVALYVWDYAEGMEMLRMFWDAVREVLPHLGHLDEAERFPICDPDRLHELFSRAGLRHVDGRAIDIVTEFDDFDDYWRPFELEQGPAGSLFASLEPSERRALTERVRAAYGRGSRRVAARAFAVRGTV